MQVATDLDPRIAAALDQALQAGEVGVQVAAYLDGELVVAGTLFPSSR